MDIVSMTGSPDPTPVEVEEDKYLFFPAERAESQENYQQHQLTTPAIESLPDTEAATATDLTHHLSSALNLATVTWTQDPYRAEEVSEENIPSFDIDFSKKTNQQ